MPISKSWDQHIAVFGEAGSGKTVMLSSFFGSAQEPQFTQEHLFRIVADDTGQGNRLHQNYLGMRDDSLTPLTDHFASATYNFSLKLKATGQIKKQQPAFNSVRLVWHDYPGEWFEDGVSTDVEAQRRIDTFKNLLQSDVALILVDANRILDAKGQETLYLKSLLGNLKNTLLSLQDDIMPGGKKLDRFPRIWIFALSKCDLLPDYDVYKFRDLLIAKVAGEITELREVLAGFVTGEEALSVGEDYALMSSAKFREDHIETEKRIGVDLVLPIAATLPLQRHLHWATVLTLPGKLSKVLVNSAGVGFTLLGKYQHRLPAPFQKVLSIVNPKAAQDLTDLAGEALDKLQKEALDNKDYLAATATSFQRDLENAIQERIFLRSEQ